MEFNPNILIKVGRVFIPMGKVACWIDMSTPETPRIRIWFSGVEAQHHVSFENDEASALLWMLKSVQYDVVADWKSKEQR